MSFTRIQIIDRDKYAFDMGSRSHFWRYVQSATQKGDSLQVSVVVGAHPVFYLLAASFIENEYSIAAKLIDATFTNGVTNHVPIPAEAEIVIEAEVIPNEYFHEGPCGEFTGYMAEKNDYPNVIREFLRNQPCRLKYEVVKSEYSSIASAWFSDGLTLKFMLG